MLVAAKSEIALEIKTLVGIFGHSWQYKQSNNNMKWQIISKEDPYLLITNRDCKFMDQILCASYG